MRGTNFCIHGISYRGGLLTAFLGSCVMAFSAPSGAAVTLAPLFSDHAVLQCDKPVPVWGRAAAGESITVTFHEQTVRTVAGKDGRWIVYLKPLAASAEPAELVVVGAETVTARDMVVGEVWLASGQSNMWFPVRKARAAEQEMAAANFPLIRQLRSGPCFPMGIEHTVATAPADTVETDGWQPAAPKTVGEFTAIGYFFARDIHRKLGVPVGIIHCSWPGSPIESWMSDAARRSTAIASQLDVRWQHALSDWPPERMARYPAAVEAWFRAQAHAEATRTGNPVPYPEMPVLPGGLFNGMIAPLQPGALRGILWYQGEANAWHAGEYAELCTTLIRSWRDGWGQGDLPFYFVQLASSGDEEGSLSNRAWAQLREAQAKALALPATGMVVAIDVREESEQYPVRTHPTNKQEIARRLALIAEAQVYGIPGDVSGPIFAGVTREGHALRVRFTPAGTRLVAHDQPVQALEIAGADRIFHAATAEIERDTLLVSSPAVNEPVAVRYAWSNAPVANLYDEVGLPAVPFRSDNW